MSATRGLFGWLVMIAVFVLVLLAFGGVEDPTTIAIIIVAGAIVGGVAAVLLRRAS